MAEIGRRNSLQVLHNSPQGLYLDGGELGAILLPNRYAPEAIPPGEPVDVFIYRDSEDRLVATTEEPLIQVGEFACLRVIGTHEKAGAFLDWGLQKDLLLPFRENAEQCIKNVTAAYVHVSELFDEYRRFRCILETGGLDEATIEKCVEDSRPPLPPELGGQAEGGADAR